MTSQSIFPVGSIAYENEQHDKPNTVEETQNTESFFPKTSMAYESDVKEGNICPAVGAGHRAPRVRDGVVNYFQNEVCQYDEHFVIQCSETKTPCQEFAYGIKTASGLIEGKTSSDGKTSLVTSDKQESVELEYLCQLKVGLR
ncbi:hypothetical protein SAMN04488136_101311 [Vibrio xiamenensis]|uniref:Uncharacterized protein n=1 Tax=Vibrio xiamenensis TaxID=861298 RepID=A0A1G7WBS6_9VIBR|nr:hypothetical protein [Vibrio xiamenensis]SDG69418.1 hypothetical protein SAMN04488136_101311 [Vibrio xiamenensis]